MSLSAVLVTGLAAGGISCAAVQGGLLAGLVTRQRHEQHGAAPSPPAAAAARARWRIRTGVADDLAPVGGFLAGKLASHTLLGALLGAVGSAVQLSVAARTMVQIAAGLLVIVFGLAQLGAPGFRNIIIEPPASWSRFVRGRTRSGSALAPAILGLATVLIPCGVTLSVEALALASGSPVQGALIMAVFVTGTSPLFAALGYLARRAATAWRGRLAVATGLMVVALGLYTLNGGLELAGSPLAASNLARAVRAEPPVDAEAGPAVSTVDGRQLVVVTATTGSYSPADLQVQAGLSTTLIVRAKQARGCVRAFVIPSQGRQWILPEDGDTRIDLGMLEPGRLAYSCGMGMYTGSITIRQRSS